MATTQVCTAGVLDSSDLLTLMGAIVLKHHHALVDLYTRAGSRLYATAYRILRSKQDAEEIVADVFLYVWEYAEQYRCERGSVMAWMSVIARNRAIDRLRQRRQTLSTDDQDVYGWVDLLIADTKTPEESLERSQAITVVRSAMASLSSVRQKLVALSFFEDLTHAEIATAMAMPHGTVKSHIRRGLMAMRNAVVIHTSTKTFSSGSALIPR